MTNDQNPFKEIGTDVEPPKELREKLMRDLNYIRFFTDIADLFSMKYAATVQTLFKTETGQETNLNEKKQTRDGDKNT